MKTNKIVLVIIVGFLMLGMLVTNPTLEDHRNEVTELLKKTVADGSFSTQLDAYTPKKQLETVMIGTRIINTTIDRTNLVLFSLTKMQVGGNSNTIGLGIFGSVFLYSQTGYQLSWQIDQEANKLKSAKRRSLEKPKKTRDYPVEVPTQTYIENQNDAIYTVGYYRPNASDYTRVYFHSRPDYATRRNAYLVTQDLVYVEQIKNGFGYVKFTNDRGQVTTGWLDMAELTPY